MAFSASNTYVYVDKALNTFTVSGSTLHFRGIWSAGIFYSVNNVVQIGKDLYICRSANQGQAPTGIVDNRWSTLVEVTPAASAGTDTYARTVAEAAKAEADTNSQQIAQIFYELGTISGTSSGTSGGPDDDSLATAAWVLAQYGTNTGTAAYNLASQAETDAGNAMSVAVVALNTAWTGTKAWVLAEYGTNTGTYALQVAQEALGIAIIGTNNSSGAALTLAQYATNTGTYALQVAQEALGIAIIGTNVGTYAEAIANEALNIAIIGTNVGTYAETLANQALTTSWVGTHKSRAIMLCAAYTPITVGPDTAELPIPYSYDGTTSLTWNVKRATFRVNAAGTGPAIVIEKSSGNGVFSATAVTPTLALGNGAYEVFVTGTGAFSSGDKCRFNVLTLGSSQNWTVTVEIANP